MKIKKIVSYCLTFIMCLSVFALVGCGGNKNAAKTIMNVSLNPKIEFILDKDGKVETVNALNEDGNLIVSSETFVDIIGKTAEEAGKLFTQASKELGFLISGRVSDAENKIKIAFSGEVKKAEKLYNKVKSNIETYLTAENVTAAIEKAEAVTTEKLQELVSKCSPYLEDAKIKAMSQKELLEELVASRKETAKLYSEQLKETYYKSKEYALEQAKFDAVKNKLTGAQKLAFDIENGLYKTAVSAITTIRNSFFLGENSVYQIALSNLREKKAEFILYRNELAEKSETEINQEMLDRLNNLETAFENAETALNNAKQTAEEKLSEAENQLAEKHTSILEKLSGIDINAYANEISQKQTEALNNFYTNFENDYSSAKTSINNKLIEIQNQLNKKVVA